MVEPDASILWRTDAFAGRSASRRIQGAIVDVDGGQNQSV